MALSEMIKAQKGTLVKYFSLPQWNNMNKELVNHGWVMVGETPNSNPDIPEEIINFKKLQTEKAKEIELQQEKEANTEDHIYTEEVPGFEEKAEIKPEIEEKAKKEVFKKKGGRPKRNNYANKK